MGRSQCPVQASSLPSFYQSRNQRTLLLFVIRDHIGTTPLANLQATLTQDMQKIWETLSKPSELKDKQLSDYFDLSFAALTHKILAVDKFESEVAELRKRFADKSRDDYVFLPAYHKRIPADGVAFYMEGIWVRHFEHLSLRSTHAYIVGTSTNQQGLGLAHAAGTSCAVPL